MQLKDILVADFTDAEYLARQRDLHKARCDKAITWIKKDIRNESVLARLLKEAEYSMKNLFCIPGSRGLRIDVGTPPRWSDSITDDEEGLWVLNRTHYFNDLCKLYHLVGEKEYAKKVLFDMENWIDTCPLPSLLTRILPRMSISRSDEFSAVCLRGVLLRLASECSIPGILPTILYFTAS